jgi:hypothetical protein
MPHSKCRNYDLTGRQDMSVFRSKTFSQSFGICAIYRCAIFSCAVAAHKLKINRYF